jgi:hypothetical protein
MFMLVFYGVLVASFGAALPARAADVRPVAEALSVRRGAACVDRDSLGAQLAAWLGKPAIDRELSVLVVGSASDPRDVSFEVRRGRALLARRRFAPAPPGCAPLEAILALAIAMALKVSLRDELMASLARAPARSALQGSVAAFAELGLGLLPGRSAGVVVRAELRSLFALRLDVLSHTSQNQRLSTAVASFDVDAWLVGMRLAACLPVSLARALLVGVCAGLGAGGIYVVGRGPGGARSAWLPWLDVGAGAELSVALSEHWSIDAGGNAELPVGERRYGVRNADGTVAASRTLPHVAGSLRVGPAYHF